MTINVEVLSDQEDKLLERRQISFKVTHQKAATPKRTEIRKQLADVLKVNPETIQLRPLKQKTGRNEADGIALIYKSPDSARLIEQQYLADRLKPKEKKEEEKPKTEEKAKAPAAPKKEEKKEKKEEKKDVK